ncbi:MAG: sensor histidine kinase [Actinomycetota bacterium]
MSVSRARIAGWGLWFFAIAITVITLTLVWLNRSLGEEAWFVGVAVFFILGYVTVGALIVARQPRNPIGWLFITVGLGFLVGGLADEWVTYALITHPGSMFAVTFFVWLSTWASVLAASIPLIFILFPDGHPPTPRWRPIVILLIGAIMLSILGSALTPAVTMFGSGDVTVDVRKPMTLPILDGAAGTALGWTAGLAMLFGGLAAVASLVLRWRRSQGDERQQIRWVAAAAGSTGLALIAVVATTIMAGGEDSPLSNAAFIALLVAAGVGVPVATGIGVLKYRLYDLGLVVKKTLVFAVVATMLTALYGTLLFLVPLLVLGVGSGSGFSSWQFLVTIAIALSFAPIRRRARKLADRIVYGGRATPYEVLSDFSERLGETYSTDDVLPRMAQLLGASTGATEVMVLLKRGGELVPSTVWPDRAHTTADPRSADEVSVFPVLHQGEELGAITLRMSARDPMNPAKEQLVRDVASQAGLVLRNVRLIDDLRESRRRIVAAQDERAKRLERNIHDGAQQQLVALAVKLRLAQQLAERDPAKTAEMLGDLQSDANDALENLRDLARGVYPPLLADRGLTAALEAQARKAPMPVRIDADGAGRYPAEVEATVYFCALEALQNVAKYAGASEATVSLVPRDGTLMFTVADDGRGFELASVVAGSGLQGMRDRVEAVGGSLAIESGAGRGTTVTGRVPITAV